MRLRVCVKWLEGGTSWAFESTQMSSMKFKEEYLGV